MNRYFNANIFEKVLEYVILPSKGLQCSNFLFPQLEPLLEPYIKSKEEMIRELLLEEVEYQEEVGYVQEQGKAKERWFAQLREGFELPTDYQFE